MSTNNPIRGLGNDIIEIDRIRESLSAHPDTFLQRILTPQEIEHCKKHQDIAPHLAGRFAAKEAIAKALGTGFGEHLSFHDVIITPSPSGQPHATLSPKAAKHFHSPTILLSISHSRTHATAVAIVIGE